MEPKIPKMSKKKRKVWIEACEKLLEWYQTGKNNLGNCPFCETIGNVGYEGCYRCIWMWFTGMPCTDYVSAIKGDFIKTNEEECIGKRIKSLREERPLCWRKLRIRQLKIWIKKLEEE